MADRVRLGVVMDPIDHIKPVKDTTLGMLLANVPVVFLGERFAARLPVRLLHRIAAAVFAGLGLFVLLT